jgi:hypothetical protein
MNKLARFKVARADGGRMHSQSDPLAAEQQFLSSLIGGV